MHIKLKLLKSDLTIGLYTLTNKAQELSEVLKKIQRDIRLPGLKQLEKAAVTFNRKYKELDILSTQSKLNDGPYSKLVDINDENFFQICLVKPILGRNDMWCGPRTYSVTTNKELAQLNKTDRHVLVQLRDYHHILETQLEIINKVLRRIQLNEISIPNEEFAKYYQYLTIIDKAVDTPNDYKRFSRQLDSSMPREPDAPSM